MQQKELDRITMKVLSAYYIRNAKASHPDDKSIQRYVKDANKHFDFDHTNIEKEITYFHSNSVFSDSCKALYDGNYLQKSGRKQKQIVITPIGRAIVEGFLNSVRKTPLIIKGLLFLPKSIWFLIKKLF